MKDELQFKDFCGYLPYGLKYVVLDSGTKYRDYDTIDYIDFINNKHDFQFNFGNGEDDNLQNSTIILRPIYDLYKPIIHNGKEIFPIVELAKISTAITDWIGRVDGAHCVKYCLRFNIDDDFVLYDWKNNKSLGISNQYQLFDYIHELKIDYRGLIDAGLAISVHDLEFNPYN